NRSLVRAVVHGAIKAEVLGKYQAAIAADLPAVDDTALMYCFAHGGAPEHDRLGEEELRAGSERNRDRSGKAGAVEQDRLLRQPHEFGAVLKRRAHVKACIRAKRTIDLFRRRSGHWEPRPSVEREIDRKAVAARDAAGGVDEHRLRRARAGVGKSHPQRALLPGRGAASAARSRGNGEADAT